MKTNEDTIKLTFFSGIIVEKISKILFLGTVITKSKKNFPEHYVETHENLKALFLGTRAYKTPGLPVGCPR